MSSRPWLDKWETYIIKVEEADIMDMIKKVVRDERQGSDERGDDEEAQGVENIESGSSGGDIL